MPLIPRDNGGLVEVEIDGDVYWLKKRLGWYERSQASEMKGITFYYKQRDIEDGLAHISKDDYVPVTLDGQEDAQLGRLYVWLAKWSHKDDLSKLTLRRLPQRHAERLLEEITRLEQEQDGPTADDPLDAS